MNTQDLEYAAEAAASCTTLELLQAVADFESTERSELDEMLYQATLKELRDRNA